VTPSGRPIAVPIRRVEDVLLRRVAERAEEWLPGVGAGPPVELRLLRERPRALLYRIDVGEGPGRRLLLAKVRRGWPGSAQQAGARPRLVPDLLPAAEQTALEFAGLTAIHALFGADGQEFGAVRPLEHLAAEDAIVMEYVDAPTVRDVLAGGRRAALPGRRSARLRRADACRRSGAWLAAFQQQMPHEGLPARQATRDEVVDRFQAFTQFLTGRLGARAVGDAARSGARLAADVLPERLPLAVGHGDYAPRNLFALSNGRVAVFDPLCRWRVPRLEDLCRFLVAVRLQAAQLHTHGAAYGTRELDRCEAALIGGYRGAQDLPLPELRCYQLLITLDRWCALLDSPAGTPVGRLRRTSVVRASGYLRRETRRLVQLADAAAAG
jgi:hypothetical protein